MIGSVGSATLLYGLAFIYGASGSTDFAEIARAIGDAGIAGDPLLLTGIALAAAGLAFKASVAPFHQWTPDVYEGAPTSGDRVHGGRDEGGGVRDPAALLRRRAAARPRTTGTSRSRRWRSSSIVIGNIGAIGQDSLKRMLAWSGVAQAGYMLAGVVVATELGVQERRLLPVRLPDHEHGGVRGGDRARARDRARRPHRRGRRASARRRPALAWPLTISMLGLAGLPGTAGFIGKFFLIEASVDGDFTWLGVVIVIGSMVSLVYYLRVIAAVWMEPSRARAPVPAMAGGVARGRAESRRVPARGAGRSPIAVAGGRGDRLLRHRPEPAARPRLGRRPPAQRLMLTRRRATVLFHRAFSASPAIT